MVGVASSLTRLEASVLAMIVESYPEHSSLLEDQIARLTNIVREHTGMGVYVDFEVGPGHLFEANLILHDVNAQVAGLQHPAGFILSIRDGCIRTLEGFTYGDDVWPISDEVDFHVYFERVPMIGAS